MEETVNEKEIAKIKMKVSVKGLEEKTEKIKELAECLEKANSLLKELANSDDLSVTVEL